eukprot:Hpha_TRINITY_DN15658_c0_g4::TRINITY_DN15658_c0_g4_i1::g.100430::m.100430
MGGCCRWGWLAHKGDTPEDARIKVMLFPFALFSFLGSMIVIANILRTTNQMVNVLGLAINAFAYLLFMGGVVSNVMPASYLLDVFLVLCTVGICAVDLGNATTSSPWRSWAYVVLVLD